MKTYSVPGTSSKKISGWFFDFREQWSSLFGHCNWYDFTFIHVGGEVSPYKGSWEIELSLLGLCARITYVYDKSFNEKMMGDYEKYSHCEHDWQPKAFLGRQGMECTKCECWTEEA